MLSPEWNWLALLLMVMGDISYVWLTLQGKTTPHRVTWFLWALIPSVALVAQLHEGVGLVTLQTVGFGLMPALVFVASFRAPKATWVITRFDVVCGCLSLVGLLLWALTREGDYAVAFSIAADGLAALPTLRKAWSHPDSESPWAYLGGALGSGLTLLTITSWTFIYYGFALYGALMTGLLAFIIITQLGTRRNGESSRVE